MTYRFKQAEELAWVAITAGGTFLLELAVKFEPETVTNWQAYGIAAGAGVLRAIAGAALAARARRTA